MKTAKLFLAFSILLALVGCASVQTAAPEIDAQAKTFPVQTDKGNLYIYRNESFGGAVSMKVTVNGEPIGKTGPKSFFWLKVAPGLYNIVSDAENTSTLPIQVVGGRDYFVWQEVKLGALYARTKLQEVDAQTGKAGVLESKMIQVDPSIVIKPFPTDNNRQSTEVTVTGNSRQKLEELQGLKKEGLITEKDYQEKRSQILKSM